MVNEVMYLFKESKGKGKDDLSGGLKNISDLDVL